jgi:hypothetical protein
MVDKFRPRRHAEADVFTFRDRSSVNQRLIFVDVHHCSQNRRAVIPIQNQGILSRRYNRNAYRGIIANIEILRVNIECRLTIYLIDDITLGFGDGLQGAYSLKRSIW